MKSSTGNKLVYGIVIALAGVFCIVVLSVWQYRRTQEEWAWVRHTNEVLIGIGGINEARARYQLNFKDFLITGDSDFLHAAGNFSPILLERIRAVKGLTADNPVQQRRFDSLIAITANDHGSRMQVLKEDELVSRLEAEERILLDRRREDSMTKASELQWILWGLIAAVLLLTFILFRKIRLDLRRQTTNLESTEEKYKTLFYKSPLPKWIYDENTMRFLEVNDTAIRVYGYTREEFLGMTIADIRPPEDAERLRRNAPAVRGRVDVSHDTRWRHVKKNGEIIDVEITSHSFTFEGHEARLVAVSDVSAYRRYEEQLRQLNDDLTKRAGELATSNAELERFAYIASHDLQEPLRMVTSFLQLLKKRYGGRLDEKADQYIHFAVDGAERMKTLILDLLEYSRVGSGKEAFGKVDTGVVLKEMADIFQERIVIAGARIDIGPMPVVWGDKVQLTQLFQNLLGNALKYHSDRKPLISIRAAEEAAFWQFAVEDNGIGIDPQFFDKIFVIFQRLHTKGDYSGTGIGLAICKKIVDRHGGKIWVESVPEKGSTFYFTIAKKI
ncbi:MAG TPA: ATP-binding protein [Puia sp.]|jgi:PAS domain S-box-containing protein|nr:ATP-binding protein [Puia sp.]